ncbi:DUF4367 domain-containing protein [Gottfriedia luciferensis]|uniref:DUF4367 domain-containing protein n=1 Tax=Gottfriedia luciferensis TaxID=178774 RepID=UPI000B436723|nr:DUF4367 domain-containing protein [Gottfriedia luciferensis]
MVSSIRLFIVLIFLISSPVIIKAKEIKYNHNSITLPTLKNNVDFKVFAPKNVPKDWTLEIKTYPWGEKEKFTYFRLHYMDSNDTKLLIGIEQRKELRVQDEHLGPNAKQVDINGNKGYFVEWANSGQMDNNHGQLITGGLLFWNQGGTHIKIDSMSLSEEKILEIARSMK